MDAQGMTDALKHPHPGVPFANIGDDTIFALASLAEIFTKKFKKADAHNIQPAPQKYLAIKEPTPKAQPIINSPIKRNYRTRSQTKVRQALENVQEPPWVITPATRSATPLRVPTRTRQLSPRNLF
jgi:hypothetical protein